MIIVQGYIPIRPERRDEALSMARRMSQTTRSEPGCISYEFFIGLSDPNTLMLFQEWENMEVLLAHFQTDHMDEFMRGLPNIVAGEVVTRRYAVQSVDEDKQAQGGTTPTIH